MPIVSINLSQQAYEAYKGLEKGGRSRRVSYLLMRNYGFRDEVGQQTCTRCRGLVNPMIEVGDIRIRENGDRTRWTVDGWKMVEDSTVMEAKSHPNQSKLLVGEEE